MGSEGAAAADIGVRCTSVVAAPWLLLGVAAPTVAVPGIDGGGLAAFSLPLALLARRGSTSAVPLLLSLAVFLCFLRLSPLFSLGGCDACSPLLLDVRRLPLALTRLGAPVSISSGAALGLIIDGWRERGKVARQRMVGDTVGQGQHKQKNARRQCTRLTRGCTQDSKRSPSSVAVSIGYSWPGLLLASPALAFAVAPVLAIVASWRETGCASRQTGCAELDWRPSLLGGIVSAAAAAFVKHPSEPAIRAACPRSSMAASAMGLAVSSSAMS